MDVYVLICIYMYVCIYIYIYIYTFLYIYNTLIKYNPLYVGKRLLLYSIGSSWKQCSTLETRSHAIDT